MKKEVLTLLLQEINYLPIAETIAKVLIPAITAAIAIYNWRASKFRSKIKDDLDILKRYRDEFPDDVGVTKEISKHIRARIERRMYKAYVLRGIDKSDIVSGIAFVALALAPWIFSGWHIVLRLVLSAAAAGFGLAFLYAGIKAREEERKIKALPAKFDA